MPDLSPAMLMTGFIYYVVFLFSTTCHEAAHAFVAKMGGDTTASIAPSPVESEVVTPTPAQREHQRILAAYGGDALDSSQRSGIRPDQAPQITPN